MVQGTIRHFGGLDDEVYLEFADGGTEVEARKIESRKEERC
jgi:hypothetical protein